MELNPIAAVTVQLLHNGIDVQISGPVQITLPLAESSQSQLSYTVPAWSFDRKIGKCVFYWITYSKCCSSLEILLQASRVGGREGGREGKEGRKDFL